MNAFDNVLRDVFDNGAGAPIADEAEERELIGRAQLGDEEATIALIYAYAFALRDVVARYRYSHTPAVWDGNTIGSTNDPHEARSVAVAGLLEAIHAFAPDGPHRRLAATAYGYVRDSAAGSMADAIAVSVPSRTVKRFFAFTQAAETLDEAEELAAASGVMSRETFRSVAAAVSTDRLDGLAESAEDGLEAVESSVRPVWTARDAYADVEDVILVRQGFEVLDERELRIVRLSFGFEDGEPQTDAEIAYRLGMTKPTVQRVRTKALRRMRESIDGSGLA